MPRTRSKRKAATQRAETDLHKALAYPLRVDILVILSEEVTSASKMAKKLGESTGTVSYHVRKLVEFGCAEKVGEKPRRGAVERFFRATKRNLVNTEDWEQLPQEMKDDLVGGYAQSAIDDIVLGVESRTISKDKDFHLTQTRHVLDQKGLLEVLEAQETTRLQILEIEERSAKRLAKSDEKGIHASSFQGCFKLPASNSRVEPA